MYSPLAPDKKPPVGRGRRSAPRRAVLSGATRIAAGGAIAAVISGRPVRTARSQAAVGLPQSKVLTSAGGDVALTLTATPGVVDVGAQRPITTSAFDNVLTGHTWKVNPGDTLTIDLVNKLPMLNPPHVIEVEHCHILSHGNLGMMAASEVAP